MTHRERLLALAPLALALVLAAVLAAIEPPRRISGTDRYVIPAGTADRVRAGLPVDDVLPQRIDTTVGRALVVLNQDSEHHVFGPFVLAPGQEWLRQFAAVGDYSVACSVYPATGFSIAVAPAPVRGGPSDLVRSLALVAWALVAGLALAGAGLALAQGEAVRDPPDGGSRDSALGLLRLGALLLPGTLGGLLVLSLVALSRLAPWRPVLASPVAMGGLIALTLAGAAALFVLSFLAPADRPAPALLALGGLSLVLALAAGLWLALRWQAPAWALALTGLALLATALAGGRIAPVRRPLDPGATARWLAAVGCGLFLAGLPWPAGNPAQQALGALVSLAAALALLALAAWAAKGGAPAGRLWLSGGAGLLAATWAGTMLFLATAAHIEATTIPLAGNPVRDTPDSVARGEALWRAWCAGCHTGPEDLDIAPSSDRDLFTLITRGTRSSEPGVEDMPGFAYDLDIAARGDIVNYLRASER